MIGAFLIATGGGFAGAFAMFYLPVTEELNFTQTGFAGYVTIMSMCGIVSQPFIGRLLTRYRKSVRSVGVMGAVLGFACCFWFSRCNHLAQFYVGGAVISLIVPIVNGNLGASAVTQWFSRRRGTAISIISIGTSAGTVFYAQLVRFFIERSGWRDAYLYMGIFIFLITMIGTALISPPPELYGMEPYGGRSAEPEESGQNGMPLRKVLRLPCFWLLSFCALFASTYIMGVQQSVTSMLQVDYGFTPALAAGMLSLYSLVCAASKFLMGTVYDRRGAAAAISITCAAVCTSLLVLLLAHGRAAATAAMVLYGMGNMFGTVILSAYVADVFGRNSFSSVLGYVNIFFTIGVGMGPLLAARSFDVSGSYRGAYALFIACCLCSTALLLLSSRYAKTVSCVDEK